MKLFLASQGFGGQSEKLLDLVGEGRRAGVIVNAADHKPTKEERKERLLAEIKSLSQLGFDCEEIDLRNYFEDYSGLAKDLSAYDLIWVRGGNTFLLARAFKRVNFLDAIKGRLISNEIAYGGYSAGAAIAGVTLKGLDKADDPNVVPEGYNKEIVWQGLGLVDYTIVPHVDNVDFKERADAAIEAMEKAKISYKPLTDNEIVIVDTITK